jgi:hypothetical protein
VAPISPVTVAASTNGRGSVYASRAEIRDPSRGRRPGGRSRGVVSFGRSRRRARFAPVVLALIAAAAAGCGGGDDSGPETGSATTGEAATGAISELRERFDRQVRDLLTDRRLDPAVIDCALERLRETVSDAEIASAAQEIKQTGTTPAALIDAATAAGADCAGT